MKMLPNPPLAGSSFNTKVAIHRTVRAQGAGRPSLIAAIGSCWARSGSIFSLLVLFVALTAGSVCGETKIRVGHFPNVTHVQALVAHALSRQGKGWFEERLGGDTKIEWFVYNAGPSAMEAVFANSIDLTYVGPSPAINAYAKSRGEEIRIVAGAANGGAALIIPQDSGLKSARDFRGKKIATPQLGNTQDVSCRAWLTSGGLKITQLGGDAQILPAANPDQLSLFQQKKVDAVWTVEPWVSRLEAEAGGKVLVEETDSPTTILVSSVKFLNGNGDLVKRFVEAHRALTDWIEKNSAEAQNLVVAELQEETRGQVSRELIAHAWKRIALTSEVHREALDKFVVNAKAAGFLRDVPDLSRLIDKLAAPLTPAR
jgi:NitT/TauT family transport system substrate-binding protein